MLAFTKKNYCISLHFRLASTSRERLLVVCTCIIFAATENDFTIIACQSLQVQKFLLALD